MAANRACLVISPKGVAFRRDLNQVGKQIGTGNAAQAWTLLWDMLMAVGWEPSRPVSSHPCRAILLNGEQRSGNSLSLNPAFTDWMMGWPPGWTEPCRPVTGWSHWLQRARGAC